MISGAILRLEDIGGDVAEVSGMLSLEAKDSFAQYILGNMDVQSWAAGKGLALSTPLLLHGLAGDGPDDDWHGAVTPRPPAGPTCAWPGRGAAPGLLSRV